MAIRKGEAKATKAERQQAAKRAVALASSNSSSSISSSTSSSSSNRRQQLMSALGRRVAVTEKGGKNVLTPPAGGLIHPRGEKEREERTRSPRQRARSPRHREASRSPSPPAQVPGSVDSKLRRELEELRKFKEQRLAEDALQQAVDVRIRPKGEAGRSGNNPKKPGFNLLKAMRVSKERYGDMQDHLDSLQGELKIPRGANITQPRYTAHLKDVFEAMEDKFPELNKRNFPDYWAVRDMIKAKTSGQRHQKAEKKNTAEDIQGGEKEKQVQRSSLLKEDEDEEDQNSGPKNNDDEEDAGDNDGNNDYDNRDDEPLNSLELWQKLGPTLGPILLGTQGLNLSDDWADYPESLPDRERRRLEAIDKKIRSEYYEVPTPPTKWEWFYGYVKDRFDLTDPLENEEFEAMWDHVWDTFLDLPNDPRPMRVPDTPGKRNSEDVVPASDVEEPPEKKSRLEVKSSQRPPVMIEQHEEPTEEPMPSDSEHSTAPNPKERPRPRKKHVVLATPFLHIRITGGVTGVLPFRPVKPPGIHVNTMGKPATFTGLSMVSRVLGGIFKLERRAQAMALSSEVLLFCFVLRPLSAARRVSTHFPYNLTIVPIKPNCWMEHLGRFSAEYPAPFEPIFGRYPACRDVERP
ncbi:hypothetical protein DFP72DRAFT_847817 [Ephemerocybe angulata]|uniref:Uncharacterized protein n=1 Tax=Ephemerocybe angulata TaxID=980116 RepID=A0A8H6HY48_9AGAR|nr:hypothetical protein DFP72DRAFT_847817 [Tulosesus angulatus]